ncbi:hypothetical protein I4U23_006873 [Adineta vaga]|nr:hypothetical protein I4U23_006873 [Adineta vaga]
MLSSIGFTQRISRIIKFNWYLLFAAVILIICCTCVQSKSIDTDQLSDRQMIGDYYPNFLFADDSDLVVRASPRLGRASPRLGRASPRLGRRTAAFAHSRLNHADRYHNGEDDDTDDYQNESESSLIERRASPRLGRSV